MKISLIQMNSISDKAANIAAARALIEEAVATERPDWICLPEVFDWHGGTRADKLREAETLPDGPASSMCREMARKHRVFIHAGSIMERIEGEERIYNATIAFNREGEAVAHYRKIHMFDITAPDGTAYNESATIKPGRDAVTYDCEGVTVGCAICYDLRFPYLFAKLAEMGAQLIALPSSFTLQTGKDHWEVLCRARAIETQTYFCAAGQTGSFGEGAAKRFTYGQSLIADPWGLVVARASDGVGIVSARIDPVRVAKVRSMMPVAQHRVMLG